MAAREECRVKQNASSSALTLDGFSPMRNASTHSGGSGKSAAGRRLRSCRGRSSSLDSLQREQLAVVFRGFEFPKPPPSRHGENESSGPNLNSKPLPELPWPHGSRPSSPLKLEVPYSRMDTPPSLDPEDSPVRSRKHKPKKLQLHPSIAPPTPESSPDFGPVSDWQIQEKDSIDILNEGLCKDIQRQLDASFGQTHLGSPLAQQPGLEPSPFIKTSRDLAPQIALPPLSLNEPDFDEFLLLSDENVLEYDPNLHTPAEVAHASGRSTSSTSSLPMRNPSLLTLEPPGASRATAAAAFEAARIASRYQFDMLYVVNLWPEESNARAHVSSNDGELPPMTGRLLAAYGLHNSPSPFQISSDVHGRILGSEGWLEYRDEQAISDDFSRAYACAFYPGHFDERPASNVIKTSGSKNQNLVDRGIVFAAYRKPKPDGSIQYSSPEELALLQRDVQTMVEVLIDVHVASQMRQPPILSHYSDEVGPIPAMETLSSGL